MNISNDNINAIVAEVLKKVVSDRTAEIPVGVSNRHIHLSQKDLAYLFGDGYSLNKMKDLKQPNQFASKETVTIVGPRGALHNVRILGPARKLTQVEISRSDAFVLGVNAPVRISGDTKNSAGIIIIGPKNTLTLQEGVIIASNHLHLSGEEANKLGLANGQKIVVRAAKKERKIYFAEVVVRCGSEHLMEFHIDTDEANSALLDSGDMVEIVYI